MIGIGGGVPQIPAHLHYVRRMAADETDEHNSHPPPTTGLDVRYFRGTDQVVMLREVADHLDRCNPGRSIVGLWCTAESEKHGMVFEVVIEYDEDFHEEFRSDIAD